MPDTGDQARGVSERDERVRFNNRTEDSQPCREML